MPTRVLLLRHAETADPTIFHGAESDVGLSERGRRQADELAGRTFVVVAHGMVVKVLLVSLLPGWSLADWKRLGPIHNVAVNELLRDGAGWHAARVNAVLPALAALEVPQD